MAKNLFVPLVVVLAIFIGIDFIADMIKEWILAILPLRFQEVAPLAQFFQIPIDAISNTVSSLKEFIVQFANIFIGIFSWIFGDGSFVEILSALILTIASIVAFIAYLIIGIISVAAGLIILILALMLSFFSWLL